MSSCTKLPTAGTLNFSTLNAIPLLSDVVRDGYKEFLPTSRGTPLSLAAGCGERPSNAVEAKEMLALVLATSGPKHGLESNASGWIELRRPCCREV